MQNSVWKSTVSAGIFLPPGRTAGTFVCDRCKVETAATQRTHDRDGKGQRVIVCRRHGCRPVARA